MRIRLNILGAPAHGVGESSVPGSGGLGVSPPKNCLKLKRPWAHFYA